MRSDRGARPPGDQARVSVAVAVPPEAAFRIFTEEIDRWWKRGREFRESGHRGGFIRLEPGVGGRLFESIEGDTGKLAHEVRNAIAGRR